MDLVTCMSIHSWCDAPVRITLSLMEKIKRRYLLSGIKPLIVEPLWVDP